MKKLQTGSSIIIALIVIVVAIFLLNHYGITFDNLVAAVKSFFGMN